MPSVPLNPWADLKAGLGAVLQSLQTRYLARSSTARAQLAALRRGIGKPVGAVPQEWELLAAAVPESLLGWGDEPSPAEQAAHATFGLFALHQQTMDGRAHQPGRPFAAAAAALVNAQPAKQQGLLRRFHVCLGATSPDLVATHMRALVTQLRSHGIGFDYAQLGVDLLALHYPDRQQGVRQRWGRDFHTPRRPAEPT